MSAQSRARVLFLLAGLIVIVSGLALTLSLQMLGSPQTGNAPPPIMSWLPLIVASLVILGIGWWLLGSCHQPEEDSAQRLRALLEAAPDACIVCRQDRTILMANDQAARLFGYESSLLRNQSIEKLVPNWLRGTDASGPNPSPTSTPSGSWRLGLDGNLVGRRRDGSEIPIEISVSPLEHAGQRYVVSFIRNISERKKLEDRVRHSQKLEAVGRLAGGVAHDFNNILTAIIGYSDLLMGSVPQGDPVRDGLLEIKKAGDRAAALTQQLLAFSRKQMLQPTVIDLNALIQETQKMLRRLIPEDIEMQLQLDPQTRPVRADAAQTQQVLLNLVLNARDAMPQGGKLTIQTANTDLSSSYARKHTEVRAGPYAVLSVSDTGCGMDEATQARVFEPFFTTKVQGKGTGLGLATVYGIVKQSGGHIEISSAPGQGSVFRVYLPIAEEAVPTVSLTSGLTRTPPGTETILVAEDEDALRGLVRRVLEEHGYAVLAGKDGEEALRLCRQHPGAVHLLLSDVIMPNMNGPRLAQEVKSLHPDVRVIFMSGYTDSTLVSRGVSQGEAYFLQKPFRTDTLIQLVREVLDRAPTR